MDLYAKLTNSMEEMSATFTARMTQYEEDLKNASANETVHKTIASISRDYTDFKCLVWKTMNALKYQVDLLIVGLDRHEMASRRPVLLLHGLQEQRDEDPLSQAVSTMTDSMKMSKVSSEDIVACHRLGVNTGKTRPLLIRFRNDNLRSEVWRNKTLLRGSGLILSEFLTRPRHDTFMAARKHFGVKDCWTSDGKIVILLPNKSRRKIETAAELQQLMSEYPNTQVPKNTPAKRARRPAK